MEHVQGEWNTIRADNITVASGYLCSCGVTGCGKQLPVIQPRPEPCIDPNPDVAQCGLCGMIWKQVMMYYCSNARCPMQSRTTC